MRASVAVAVGVLSVIGFAAAEEVLAGIRKSTNIPAQGLGPALQTLAKERGFQIVYVAGDVDALLTQGAAGELTAEEALTQILQGTGLSYRPFGEQAVGIVPIAASSSPSQAFPSKETSSRLNEGQSFRVAQAPSAPQADIETGTPSAGKSVREGTIDEIVVTAQKREERLQDVPVAISVLTGQELDRSTSDGVNQLLRTVPGVATMTAVQGGTTQISIRGVTSSGPLFAGSNPIAYYLDGMPFSFARSSVVPDADAYDLERVEVLRGPQGTLYGASALNGVVRILTHDAELDRFDTKVRGMVSGTEYGGANYRGDVSVNAPIIEGKLAVRASAGYQDLSGWIDKPGNNEANDSQIQTYRVKLNAKPTERLSAGLSVWLSRSDFGAPPYGFANRVNPSVQPEPVSTDYDLFGATLGYDFDSFTVSSTTSYLEFENDGSLALSTAPTAFVSETLLKMRTLNQELNLASTSEGPWKWTAGGMYRVSNEDQAQPIPGLFPYPLANKTRSESFAVFGELTREFLDGALELTGGLRYFEDRIRTQQVSGFTNPNPTAPDQDEFDKVSPRAIVTWHPQDDITVYTSYAEGFRSGGPVGATIRAIDPTFPALKPDTLKNYEIGSKGTLFDGVLAYDAAVYYVDWQAIQQALLVNIGAVNIQTMVNSKSGSGMGAEVGFTLRPVSDLTLNASFAWNDLTLDADVVTGSNVVLFPEGGRLNLSPKYTAGAGATYLMSFGGGYEGKFSTSLNYVSETETRSLDTIANAVAIAPGDSLLTGSLSFAIESPNQWTATLFVDNFTNENASPLNNFVGFPHWDQRIRPRTSGIQVEYRF